MSNIIEGPWNGGSQAASVDRELSRQEFISLLPRWNAYVVAVNNPEMRTADVMRSAARLKIEMAGYSDQMLVRAILTGVPEDLKERPEYYIAITELIEERGIARRNATDFKSAP